MKRFIAPLSAALVMTVLFTNRAAGQELPTNVLSQFRPEAIHAHMNFLAGDLLEGRGTGARGYEIAAKYVAAQFEAYGLEPGGADGTYFQQVPFRRATTTPELSSLTLRDGASSRTLEYGKDFTFRADSTHAETKLTAPVIIVGYGVTASEFGIDDYSGIDVKDKIVAIIAGAPATLPDIPRAIYSSLQTKLENAAAHGAVGVWTLRTADGSVPKANPVTVWKDKNGTPHGVPDRIRTVGTVSREVAASLLEKGSFRINELENVVKNRTFKALDTGIVATVAAATQYTDFTAPNVAAICRGSDAALKDEYVVFSAHLDHLGIGDPINGDAIYNGALDNASGSAVLLELARVFAAEKPRRSVLFLAVTGEELGLLGSDYFANYPTVTPQRIVANVNGDGANILFPTHHFVAFGSDQSTVAKQVEDVAQALNLKVLPDPFPDQASFVRSDQYCPSVKAFRLFGWSSSR